MGKIKDALIEMADHFESLHGREPTAEDMEKMWQEFCAKADAPPPSTS